MTALSGSSMRTTVPAARTEFRARRRGFTLLELMIVLTVIAILAVVAWPGYLQIVRKGARTDAKAILSENSQFMERFFTTQGTYVGGGILSSVSPKGATGTSVKYDITFSFTPAAGAGNDRYTMQAVPANGQVGDLCGTLTIDNTGLTAPAATSTLVCW